MDQSTSIVLSIALLLALNNAIVRLPFLKDRAPLFWAVQFMDLGVASALALIGIPGFKDFPAANWMLALLLILHVAQNLRWRAQRRRDDAVSEDVEARRSAIRKALAEPGDDGDDGEAQ
ncbi:MAG: hypothetical protein R3F61_33440 [Myxococcota bacterium]